MIENNFDAIIFLTKLILEITDEFKLINKEKDRE